MTAVQNLDVEKTMGSFLYKNGRQHSATGLRNGFIFVQEQSAALSDGATRTAHMADRSPPGLQLCVLALEDHAVGWRAWEVFPFKPDANLLRACTSCPKIETRFFCDSLRAQNKNTTRPCSRYRALAQADIRRTVETCMPPPGGEL